MLKKLFFVALISAFLGACSTRTIVTSTSPQSTSPQHVQTVMQRNQQMSQLKQWTIRGKIAFINSNTAKKRQSAFLRWKFSQQKQQLNQQIDLTTFLGINILHVETNNNKHLIKVDGKKIRGTNLSKMIYTLTGLMLPTKALSVWLKGIKFNSQDKILYNKDTKLPEKLMSYSFKQQNQAKQTWQIKYSTYKPFSGHQLATKFIITHDNLIIKIVLSQWSNL